MRSLPLLLLTLCGCGLPAAPAMTEPHTVGPVETTELTAVPTRTVIRLEQRSGRSSRGLTFVPLVHDVGSESAAVLISSFDCGARGRWVDLLAGEGYSFCARSGAYPSPAECTWVTGIPIGGSDADGTGMSFLVRRGEEVVGRFQVVEVTPTPLEWYQTEAPFDVTVDAFVE